MPFYDYYCERNECTVEAYHPVGVRFKTWGDVCRSAGIQPGTTPSDTAVIRLMTGITPATFRLKGLDKDDYGKKLDL